MASGAKRKTTMAKLNRERKVLEKRHKKAAKKEARKREAAEAAANGSDFAPSEPERRLAEDGEAAVRSA